MTRCWLTPESCKWCKNDNGPQRTTRILSYGNFPGSAFHSPSFIDGVPSTRRDGMLGVWMHSLATSSRHVIAVYRKSSLCRCGCGAWCTLHPLWVFLAWSSFQRCPVQCFQVGGMTSGHGRHPTPREQPWQTRLWPSGGCFSKSRQTGWNFHLLWCSPLGQQTRRLVFFARHRSRPCVISPAGVPSVQFLSSAQTIHTRQRAPPVKRLCS